MLIVGLLSSVPDIDECRDGSHQCRYNQICENTRGSYHCTCPRGFRSQGVGRPCIGTYIPQVFFSVPGTSKHTFIFNLVFYNIQREIFFVIRQEILPFAHELFYLVKDVCINISVLLLLYTPHQLACLCQQILLFFSVTQSIKVKTQLLCSAMWTS